MPTRRPRPGLKCAQPAVTATKPVVRWRWLRAGVFRACVKRGREKNNNDRPACGRTRWQERNERQTHGGTGNGDSPARMPFNTGFSRRRNPLPLRRVLTAAMSMAVRPPPAGASVVLRSISPASRAMLGWPAMVARQGGRAWCMLWVQRWRGASRYGWGAVQSGVAVL